MYEEEYFKSRYQEAYDHVAPSRGCIRRLAEQLEGTKDSVLKAVLRPAAVLGLVFLLGVAFLPAAAKASPRVYAAVVRYAPALADYCLPVVESSVSGGIRMQVEAVKMDGRTAEIIVSFSDAEEDGELVKGEIDLYNSYELISYGSFSDISGGSFLGYDEAEDKAYYKISATTFGEFQKDKAVLKVRRILTNCAEEKREISLENILFCPALKDTAASGQGGSWDTREMLAGKLYLGRAGDDDPRPFWRVMDIPRTDKNLADTLAIVGIGYADGILRVQSCRGDFADADRHSIISLTDGNGRDLRSYGVSWHEEIDGRKIMFDEEWFVVEESELEELKMQGEFFVRDGCVEGNWEVTFCAE